MASRSKEAQEQDPGLLARNDKHASGSWQHSEGVCCVRRELELTMATLPLDHDREHHNGEEEETWFGEPSAETAAATVLTADSVNNINSDGKNRGSTNIKKLLGGTVIGRKNTTKPHHRDVHIISGDHEGLLSQVYAYM